MKNEISRRNYKAGYVVIKYMVDGKEFGGDDFEMKSAFTPDGEYIGDEKTAHFLCKAKGIKPQLNHAPRCDRKWRPFDTSPCCSTGFCEKEQKWYGWSHRAIYGFEIGSETKRGDCSYVPVDMEDARQDAIGFWSDDDHLNTTAIETKDDDGKPCFDVKWTISNNVPNKKRRGQISGVRHYPPEQFGKGEWVAKSLGDAQQMAVDFAESVS